MGLLAIYGSMALASCLGWRLRNSELTLFLTNRADVSPLKLFLPRVDILFYVVDQNLLSCTSGKFVKFVKYGKMQGKRGNSVKNWSFVSTKKPITFQSIDIAW